LKRIFEGRLARRRVILDNERGRVGSPIDHPNIVWCICRGWSYGL